MSRGKSRVRGAASLVCGLLLLSIGQQALAGDWEARLDWVQRVTLGTPVSGVIDAVSAEPGTRVGKDQVLLRLDTRPLQARIAALQAARVGHTQDRDEAQRELSRTQELYDRTLLADHDLDLARIALATAEATLKDTEAQLTQANWELEFSQIRAPFDAWVLHRNAEPGQTVVSTLRAGPLIVVARAGAMLARVQVAAVGLSAFRIGQEVGVRVQGQDYRGQVRRIGLEPDASGTYPVEIAFTTVQGQVLRAGLPARVTLP